VIPSLCSLSVQFHVERSRSFQPTHPVTISTAGLVQIRTGSAVEMGLGDVVADGEALCRVVAGHRQLHGHGE
jgi:hypothetical protein